MGGEVERDERPARFGQTRGPRADDERGHVVRDDGQGRGDDADGADEQEGPDLRIGAMRLRSAHEQLAGLDAIAPALAKVFAGKGTAAMEHAHLIRVDDAAAAHQLFDQRGILADVADGLVEAGEGVAADEEVDQRDVAGAAHIEGAGAVLVRGDAAADQRRGQQRLADQFGDGRVVRCGIGAADGEHVRARVEDRGRVPQPPRRATVVAVDEGKDLPRRHGNRSISSSCGITICLDYVSNAGLGGQRLRGNRNQLERKRHLLFQNRGDGALRVATQALHGHDQTDFHQRMKLIVQIPAFNEEAIIAKTLRDIPKKLDGINTIATLVIHAGATDGPAAAARKAGATHVVQLKTPRGLASAFTAGIDAALRLGADIIVNTDADNQYAGTDIAKLIAPIIKGTADVVIGDREVATSEHMSPFKRVLQRLGSWTVGKASGLSVADVT